MRDCRSALEALMVLAAGACGSADTETQIPCGPNGECPIAFICDPEERLCIKSSGAEQDASLADAPPPADAGLPDARRPDGPLIPPDAAPAPADAATADAPAADAPAPPPADAMVADAPVVPPVDARVADAPVADAMPLDAMPPDAMAPDAMPPDGGLACSQPDRFEDNDTSLAATPIAFPPPPEILDLSVRDIDEDWYTITVDPNCMLTILACYDPAPGELGLEVDAGAGLLPGLDPGFGCLGFPAAKEFVFPANPVPVALLIRVTLLAPGAGTCYGLVFDEACSPG